MSLSLMNYLLELCMSVFGKNGAKQVAGLEKRGSQIRLQTAPPPALNPPLTEMFDLGLQNKKAASIRCFVVVSGVTFSVSTSFFSRWFSECRSLTRCSAWPSWASSSASSSLLPSWNSSSSSWASSQL